MKISFLGAAKNVTGSKHLIEVNGKKILLDCGMFQGHHRESDNWNHELLTDPKTIDVMILSHAHIDHCGLIPYWVKKGFSGPIWCTLATRDLCNVMLPDSAYIQEQDAEYINRKLQKKMGKAIPPLYTVEDVAPAIKLMKGINYYETINLFPGIKFTFYDAGHILGSAFVVLEIEENGENKTLVFSGDIGRPGMPIIRDPDIFEKADFLITESTYGNRLHESLSGSGHELAEVINRTAKRGGKVIIPSFSVGRTQELIYELHLLTDSGKIPQIPIIVDSPLSCNVTSIFQMHPECYDEEIYKEFILNHQNPFGFNNYTCNIEASGSKALNTRLEPMIIIAAAGMATGGRIVHHLHNNIENPKNTILFVGYQGEGTLGRQIRDKNNPVTILGDSLQVRAEITAIDAFSAHGDYEELIKWTEPMSKTLKKIFLVHGEEEAMISYKEKLNQKFPIAVVEIPNKGESFEV